MPLQVRRLCLLTESGTGGNTLILGVCVCVRARARVCVLHAGHYLVAGHISDSFVGLMPFLNVPPVPCSAAFARTHHCTCACVLVCMLSTSL